MAVLLRNRPRVLKAVFGLALAAVLGAASAGLAASAFLDAVLASVNGRIIAASDVAVARALSLFGLTPTDGSIGHDDVRRVADGRVIEDEARRLQIAPDPADVEEAWRAATDRVGGMEAMRRWLDQVGLDEAWVRTVVAADVRRHRFIEVRFRAFIFVTEEELTKATGGGASSPEAREKALNALRDATVAREIAAWLTEARARATIHQADLAPGGIPLPFPMPLRTVP